MNTLHVKKGDTVVILSGNDKGKSGKVTRTFPKKDMIMVEGVGKRIKHQKPRKAGQAGQIIEKFHPIHVSKVVLKK
ncbi:50S ribosomal protein L24 [Candidatus Kaiserbacteria bacterium]|nr:50S ribosomal protein L24 [Candidatus Kaiserbacteria bacterium]